MPFCIKKKSFPLISIALASLYILVFILSHAFPQLFFLSLSTPYFPQPPVRWLGADPLQSQAYRSSLPVVIYGLHNPSLGRTLWPQKWRGRGLTSLLLYNISGHHIHTYDGALIARPEITPVEGDDSHRTKQKQQNSDVRTILSHLALTHCGGHPYFLLAEDDVSPCASSLQADGSLPRATNASTRRKDLRSSNQERSHDERSRSRFPPSHSSHNTCTSHPALFHMLNNFLHSYPQAWGMVRVGVGLGVVLKCSHINSILSVPFPPTFARAIDWAITRFYEDHSVMFGRELVFRCNLLHHNDGPSNIWSAERVEQRKKNNEIAECLEIIRWEGPSKSANFDDASCKACSFSPCDTKETRRTLDELDADMREMESSS